ncbi:MAG: sugar phosphate isomerase/epimerase [Bryobacteraceae bacterium]
MNLPARALPVLAATFALAAAEPRWTHLSSTTGEMPVPAGSHQQTGVLVADFDKNGSQDFVISFRVKAPALAFFRRMGSGWLEYVIEPEFLRMEAGGAAHDIDGDGDLDIVFGNDASGNGLWWWENPAPDFDAAIPWKRHVIKQGGANQHHDQIFADFLGTGKPQLAYWNQRAKTLFLAPVPADPRAGPWTGTVVFSGQAGEGVERAAAYAEGIDAFDIDGDGRKDLLAGNYWFKHTGGTDFKAIRIGPTGGRIRAGSFRKGKAAGIVIGPGDGSGPLTMYECAGNPVEESCWKGRDLLGRDMVHGHTLDLGDVDGDGHLDIFAAEMAKWTSGPKVDRPEAESWILYGDGKGGFRKTVFTKGHGWHEGRLGDLDGDGDLDVLGKPYTWNAPRIDAWLNNGTAPRGLPRKPVGMELWTYRKELAKDLPGTLAMIRAMGFTEIETASFYGRTAAEFRKALDEHGLTCSSYITGYARLNKEMDAVIADAKALGAGYVLTAGIPRKGDLTRPVALQAAMDFNAWGAKLHASGLRFAYHPHGFEFVREGSGTLFDLLLRETRPDLVDFELDVFWVAHGGGDPLRYMEHQGKRFPLVHLKDIAKGTPTGVTTGRAPDETSVALGAGQIDWRRFLRAADKAGVKHYYIEDESPDAQKQVPLTMDFLRGLR